METLGNQPSVRGDDPSRRSVNTTYKVGDTRPPTLTEVMLNTEFLQELRDKNQLLLNFFDAEKMLEVADYVISEPKFSDSPHRCFQLPFLACEFLLSDVYPISAALFNEI